MRPVRQLALAAASVLLAACAERGPAPTEALAAPASMHASDVLECAVAVRDQAVTCAGPAITLGAGVSPLIVGGQGVFVRLTSSDVAYDATTHRFTFNTTIQNLIPQSLGTADGTTADANGLRVFFHTLPVIGSGTGAAIKVLGTDGVGTFTATAQPYYRYAGADLGADGLLSPNETSAARSWAFDVDPTVGSFTFKVYVDAAVKLPAGWVDFALTSPFVLTGATRTLAPVVRSATGVAITAPLSWSTSDAGVVTVDANGVAAGLVPGTATVTATAGERAGSTRLSVCPNLAVGELYVYSGAAAAESCVGGQSSGAEYVGIAHNASTTASAALAVTGTGVLAATGSPTPSLAPTVAPSFSVARTGSGAAPSPLVPLDYGALLRERIRLPSLEAARTVRRTTAATFGLRMPRTPVAGHVGGPSLGIIAGSVPNVGELMQLDVSQPCNGTPLVHPAWVKAVSDYAIIVADTLNPPNGFTVADYQSIAFDFDTLAYVSDVAAFGAPTDHDGNGRVVVLFTRAVNELSAPNSNGVTLGYFNYRDIYPATAGGCTKSNEGEMMYMLAPDPTGVVNGNVRSTDYVRSNTSATIGHELQHLINAWRRAYVTGATAFEDPWLNEGLSHIAEELMFYRAAGLAPRSTIDLAAVTTGATATKRTTAFNSFASQNFGRYRSWLQNPASDGPASGTSLASRGSVWAFLRYAADRSKVPESSIWYAMVNGNLQGRANVAAAIGTNDVDGWMRDFTIATYMNGSGVPVPSRYTMSSYDFRSLYSGLGGFQLAVYPLTNSVATTRTLSASGGAEFLRFSAGSSSFASLLATVGGAAPATTTSLTVVRTK